MNKATILKKEIANLCNEFGFIKNQKTIISIIFFIWRSKQATDISDVSIEIVKLILFFRQAQEDIKLEGKTAINTKSIRKGQVLNGYIQSKYLADNIESWLNTFLNDKIGANYEEEGISYKEISEWGDYPKYTDEELYQLLDIATYQKERRDTYSPQKKYKNPYFGAILYNWYDQLTKYECFGDSKQISENKKRRFLYECMVLIGEFDNVDEMLDTDKSNKVRDCIIAYKKRAKIV